MKIPRYVQTSIVIGSGFGLYSALSGGSLWLAVVLAAVVGFVVNFIMETEVPK